MQKTTLLGIMGIIGVVMGFLTATFDGNPATVPDSLPSVIQQITTLCVSAGLIVSRDNKVSDEQAGAGDLGKKK
jgi:hypothetical protein